MVVAEKYLSSSRATTLVTEEKREPAHPVRRSAALILDFVFFSWAVQSIRVASIALFDPCFTFWTIVPAEFFVVLLLFGRDSMFGGRGLAKQLLLLETVDKDTGRRPTLKQSMLRNSVLFGSCLLLQLCAIAIGTISLVQGNLAFAGLLRWLSIASSVYVSIAFVVEIAFLFLPRCERLGDKFGNTTTVRDRSKCLSNF